MLDSIVKNVGTPYTLYFGRNLFKTFMESYAVVDQPVRRKMEEMLRTWKEPVRGSMDSRPVFTHELVRPIENALMKARAASMPQPGMIPGRPRSAIPHRDTPTPPGMRGQPGYPAQQYPSNGGQPFPGQQVSCVSIVTRLKLTLHSHLITPLTQHHNLTTLHLHLSKLPIPGRTGLVGRPPPQG